MFLRHFYRFSGVLVVFVRAAQARKLEALQDALLAKQAARDTDQAVPYSGFGMCPDIQQSEVCQTTD